MDGRLVQIPSLLAFGIILVCPSFSVVKELWRPAPWQINRTFPPGALIRIPRNHHLNEAPLVNGKAFSISPRGDQWLGVLGLDQNQFVLINGQLRQNNRYPFPQVETYRLYLRTQDTGKRKVTQLQIPSSTWKKMDRKFAEQKMREREQMTAILNSSKGILPSQCMISPLKPQATIVSKFSSPRRLPNGRTYQHTGLDLRAAVGTPVKAIASGTVAFADRMIIPGKVVVIDHGGGLFSRFLHLSQISVHQGELVTKGQTIGQSGATGRVEAPHLHWEVVWKGNHANPRKFLQAWEQICDRS